jgi:anti-anti-sigma factor
LSAAEERFPLTRIDVSHRDDRAVVVCVGTLDLACARRFDQAVATAFELADACDIDLSRLTFVDSTGLRCLFRARRTASDLGRTLTISRDLQPPVLRVLELTGLQDYILSG